MAYEKIIIGLLVVLAISGLVWSATSFFNSQPPKIIVKNTPENFATFKNDELSDKCQTPPGYTDQDWQEHMSHHPDQYQECFSAKNSAKTTAIKNITADQLASMLSDKDFELIDVHIPQQAHIAKTDYFIPFDQIATQLNKLPPDKNQKIVLYCRSGNMSQTAAETLIKMGYTNVYNLVGGLNNWQQQGYQVEQIAL